MPTLTELITSMSGIKETWRTKERKCARQIVLANRAAELRDELGIDYGKAFGMAVKELREEEK